jgi:hypothetical protein
VRAGGLALPPNSLPLPLHFTSLFMSVYWCLLGHAMAAWLLLASLHGCLSAWRTASSWSLELKVAAQSCMHCGGPGWTDGSVGLHVLPRLHDAYGAAHVEHELEHTPSPSIAVEGDQVVDGVPKQPEDEVPRGRHLARGRGSARVGAGT